MRTSSIALLLGGFLAIGGSAAGEKFWINSKDGRFQVCFMDGHEWYFCTGALSGFARDYHYKLALGDGYFAQLSSNGYANITADNGCFRAHCTPEYDAEAGKQVCDVVTDSPNC